MGKVSGSHTVFWATQHGFKAIGLGWCMFKVPAGFLMYSASLTLLYQSDSCSSTDVSLYWMLCPGFHTWDAMVLLVLACITAALYSASRVLNRLPVSPMYTEPHLQGIWYTMPFCSSGGVGVLPCHRGSLLRSR